MTHFTLMGIGAGIVAAVLCIAAGTFSIVSLVLFLAAPLPLFIVGLGWGSIAAGIGAVSGAVTIAAVFGLPQGFSFLLSIGAPPTVLCYLALLSRPADESAPGSEDPAADREWYPMGRLVLWTAVLAGTLVTVSVLMTGPDAQSYREALQAAVLQSINAQPDLIAALQQTDEENLRAFVAFFVRVTPIFFAAFWTLLTLGNIWIATKVLDISGRSVRPWAAFPDIEFPPMAAGALGACLVASLVAGTPGLIAEAYTSALVTAFAVLGLAVVHNLTRDYPARVFLLLTVYLAFFMFNWLMALFLAALGVAEIGFGLRARKAFRGQGGSST